MCTLTVYLSEQTQLVTMNRDELRSRAPEQAPHDWGGWIGPRDGERGGTWFGLNRRGLVACLLNDYPDTDDPEPAHPPPREGPSRGELIPRLLQGERLEDLDLSPFPPFLLLLLNETPRLARWGTELSWEPVRPGWNLWSSSGWRSAAVQRWRAERFADWQEDGQDVLTFHTLQDPARPAWSPLADRPLSATRSLTQARLEGAQAYLRYWRAPDWPPQKPAAELALPLEGGAHPAAKPDA